MSFRPKQKYRIAMSAIPIISEETTLENGEVVVRAVKANEDMPDPEMFKIENLAKAGVSMDEVNSKVLGCRSVDVSKIFKQTKQNKQTNEDKVNENEQD